MGFLRLAYFDENFSHCYSINNICSFLASRGGWRLERKQKKTRAQVQRKNHEKGGRDFLSSNTKKKEKRKEKREPNRGKQATKNKRISSSSSSVPSPCLVHVHVLTKLCTALLKSWQTELLNYENDSH